MCKCDPMIRTPFCGRPGCKWPKKHAKTLTLDSPLEEITVEAMDGILATAFKLQLRRNALCRNPPTCQHCVRKPHTEWLGKQIQLVDAQKKPAEWKCRECKTTFFHEPASKP